MGKQWKQRQTIFWDSKITADGDCSHEIKGHLPLGRKVMTNLDSILKSRDITLPTKVRLVKAMCRGPAPAGSRGTLRMTASWIREREREKEWHGETKLRWTRPITLFSKGTFIPWLVHRGKWKMQSHTESAQTLHLFCLYRNQEFFCIPFP